MRVEELPQLVESFIRDNYVFRSLNIYDHFNNDYPYILWTYKDSQYLHEKIDSENPFKLIDDHAFYNWNIYHPKKLKRLVDDFLWKHLSKIKQSWIPKVRNQIRVTIDNGNVIKTIDFGPTVGEVIRQGRYRINEHNQLPCNHLERVAVSATVGDLKYICTSNRRPSIVSPCIVTSVDDDTPISYRVIFFTNLTKHETPTRRLTINGWGFTTAYATEIGNTPEQAARQFQC